MKRKEFYIVILAILAILFLGSKNVNANEEKGKWTDESNYNCDWFEKDTDYTGKGDGIYYISNAKELAGLAAITNYADEAKISKLKNKTIVIKNDIDLSAHYWEPIKYLENVTIEGNNININKQVIIIEGEINEIDKNIGFIAETNNVTIKNLNINGESIINIRNSTTSKSNCNIGGIGGLIGKATDSTINNVNTNVAISLSCEQGIDFCTGGIVGEMYGGSEGPRTIINSSSNGKIAVMR